MTNCALFLFDWTLMDPGYGRQAFEPIVDLLRGSKGLCSFRDGDLLGTRIITQLVAQGAVPIPANRAGEPSPLARLEDEDPTSRCFVAGLWSDVPAIFELLHSGLEQLGKPWYLGYLSLGEADRGWFLAGFCANQLSLTDGIVVNNGQVLPHTSKYGLGFDLSNADRQLLHAASFGDVDVAREALDAGANANCERPRERGDTPLMAAVCANHPEVAALLLERGANPNTSNLSNTVLMLAVRYKHAAVVDLLLDGGADVNLTLRGESTALDELEGEEENETTARIRQSLLRHGAIHGYRATQRTSEEIRSQMSVSVSGLAVSAAQSFSAFLERGDSELLARALRQATDALERTELHAPERAEREDLFARILFERFRLLGRIQDLQQSIQWHMNSITRLHTNAPALPRYFSGYGNALLDRYKRLEDPEDLRGAVQALKAASLGEPDNALMQNNYAVALLELAQMENSALVRNEAISILERAVELANESDVNLPRYLAGLGSVLVSRAEENRSIAELDAACALLDRAIDASRGNAVLQASVIQRRGTASLVRHNLFPRSGYLGEALSHLRRSAELAEPLSTPVLLQTAQSWMFIAFRHERWSEVVDAFAFAERAIDSLVFEQLFRSEAESWLAQTQGLAAQAAYAHAHLQNFEAAALALEQSQARLLSRSLALESADLAGLRAMGRTDLVERFEAAVERKRGVERQKQERVLDPTARERAESELRSTLNEIRRLPAFSDFLAKPTAPDLARAAQVSPLLYLFATEAGGAALLAQSVRGQLRCTGKLLPDLNAKTVKQALSELHPGLSEPGRDRVSEITPDKLVDGVARAANWMWSSTLRLLETPMANMGRVAIVPIGRLAFFPWAAAGPGPRPDDGEQVLDKAAVHFVPNAMALIRARSLADATPSDRLLAVESPRNSQRRLEFAPEETQFIASLFPDEPHSKILPSTEASRDAVISGLSACGTFHFSGHGYGDLEHPLRSALFLLDDERLTLEDILGVRAEGIRLGVLSACQTGRVGASLPDEFVNLPSGFLLARTAGVVASLWSVADGPTALLMMRFYWYWRTKGKEPVDALHAAQVWLRGSTNDELRRFVREHLPESKLLAWLAPLPAEDRSFQHPVFWAGFALFGL